MRITKSVVLQTAANIADEKGLSNVSLKAVAECLNIRTPSLYNHINSLDDLFREVAHQGMCEMNERMTRVAVGTYGDNAIKKIALEYLNYMVEHPGIYETIQWATWHGTDETAKIFSDYINLLTTLICSCNFKEEATTEILNLLTGILHGYSTLQLRYAFTEPEKVKSNLCNAIDTILTGAHLKYDN